MQYRTLSNGVELPMLGYGTFQIKDPVQCEKCVSEALEIGYRLFDTAASYENEAAIGRTLRGSGLPRKEWFATTKLWVQEAGYDGTLRAFEHSLQNLGFDQIDLYLIHQPFGDYYGAWWAMERLYREGAVRAAGGSGQCSPLSGVRRDQLCQRCCIQQYRRLISMKIKTKLIFRRNDL